MSLALNLKNGNRLELPYPPTTLVVIAYLNEAKKVAYWECEKQAKEYMHMVEVSTVGQFVRCGNWFAHLPKIN